MIPPVARRFVAGETSSEALDHVADLNSSDIGGILNLLGEHYEDPAGARSDSEMYEQLIADIGASELNCCISVKPSQLGLEIDAETFESNLDHIVSTADDHSMRVWVDMEDHTTVDTTLDAVTTMADRYEVPMGVCLQSNLKRTDEDLERLVDSPIAIRLVKGAYDEPASVAYQSRAQVDEVYKEQLDYLFEHANGTIAVGSHDPEMISHAQDLHDEFGSNYEVQMLMGVRTDAQKRLAQEGVTVNQYIPYGSKWFSYFYRRVRERKENLLFAARAVLTG